MMDPLKEMFEEEGVPEGEMEDEDLDVTEEKMLYKRFGFSKSLPIHQDEYDEFKLFNSNVKKYRLANTNGLVIEVMNFGATTLSIKMPDKYGNVADILLGFDTADDYYTRDSKIGAMIGRTANIIEDATFKLGSEIHFLRKNARAHHKDGGVMSFDKMIWKSYVETTTNSLILTYFSNHQEDGYPGNLLTKVVMKLSDENELIMDIHATTDEKTPVDISPRLFFNLAGHESGEETIKNHKLLINADMYIKQNSQGVPTGALKHVNQTYFDLRTPKPFHFALDKIRGGGYNHTFCLNKANRDSNGMLFAARLEESEHGRYVEIWTDSPGLYLYTANQFPESTDADLAEEELTAEEQARSTLSTKSNKAQSKYIFNSGRLIGKQDFSYSRHGAVAIAPQGYPNSVNIPEFPTAIIHPHIPFQRKIIYKFGVSNKIIPRPNASKEQGTPQVSKTVHSSLNMIQ